VSASDSWWNSINPRATNTCEVYDNGNVSCTQRPYTISPMQLALFPLLGRDYFKGLNATGTSTWTQTLQLDRGDLYKWNAVFTLEGQGTLPDAGKMIKIVSNGTFDQVGGHYKRGTSQATIVYDPVAQIPGIVIDVRTHLPQTSVANKDSIQLKLIKDSNT
jgi:hypothetical protein